MAIERLQPAAEYPPSRTPEEIQAAREQVRLGRQLLATEYQGKTLYVHHIGERRVLQLENFADLHWGADATDYEEIIRRRDNVLANPRSVKILLAGDELEGLNPRYLSTNTTAVTEDFQQQVEDFRTNIIMPLVAMEDEIGEPIILGIVSGYFGHPGWAHDSTTLQVWRYITEGTNIPIIMQGQTVGVRFDGDSEYDVNLFHYTPKHSALDPIHGSREVMSKITASKRPQAVLSGHYHSPAVSQENTPPERGKNYHSTSVVSGSPKGSNPDIARDNFGIKIAHNLAGPGGQGVLVYPRGAELNDYPYISPKHGTVGRSALEILNSTESQGMTTELLERISAEVEAKPKVDFVVRLSERDGQPFEEVSGNRTKDGKISRRPPRYPAKQWHEVIYKIDTKLPVVLFPSAHIRLGSTSNGVDRFEQELINNIAANPYLFTVLLGRTIDAEVPGNPEREAILNQLVAMITPIKDQTLAILHNRVLRDTRWKDPIGSGRLQVPPVAPGDFLSRSLNVPLLHHRSSLRLGIGPRPRYANKTEYSAVLLDELDGHGSKTKHTFGQGRVYDLHLQEKPGVVAGGHMPRSGFTVFHDHGNAETHFPILLAPGWYAQYCDTIGDGNTSPGAEPGQGVVFMPGVTQEDYLAFPTRNTEQTLDLHAALTLIKGLQQLGISIESILKN